MEVVNNTFAFRQHHLAALTVILPPNVSLTNNRSSGAGGVTENVWYKPHSQNGLVDEKSHTFLVAQTTNYVCQAQ